MKTSPKEPPPAKTAARFDATPLRPADGGDWAFVVLPKAVSETLPRRGRTTVEGTLNGAPFEQTLEPDGQLSHWLRVDPDLLDAAGAAVGEVVSIELRPVDAEPEPAVPDDLQEALTSSPAARRGWDATTTLARVDWVHWVVSAKRPATRAKRIAEACDKLAGGAKRVCCFDSSGFYSKAFKPPTPAE
ncbi:YdeI/OmpD-associated family protein [Alienimonas sp. DA493]|uniref:YdeI/OmpD-associated family protein n=1 Tax=Alienimonas sp. DA493 TaxID=3373605 RepID=UPI003754EBEB